jgi:hypothetical protein
MAKKKIKEEAVVEQPVVVVEKPKTEWEKAVERFNAATPKK